MNRQPGGDTTTWDDVLSHRSGEARDAAVARFIDNGLTPEQVQAALDDGGDAVYSAATSGDKEWADHWGGPFAVALLAAEVSALAAHLNSRASAVRAAAVQDLLDDYSAVSVAAHLGVSRQKVYDIGRGSLTDPFIDHVPWRKP